MKNYKWVFIGIIIIVVVAGIFFITNKNKPVVDNIGIPQEEVETQKEEIKSETEEETEEFVLEIGKEVDNFTLKDLNGESVSLNDYRGKIVVINFWATWCKYCDIEMPDLQNLHTDNDDVVVLAVDVKEPKSTVKEYIDNGGYTFPVLLDEDGDLAKLYYVSAYPTSFFINEEGLLVGSVPGMMTGERMDEIIEYVRTEFNK